MSSMTSLQKLQEIASTISVEAAIQYAEEKISSWTDVITLIKSGTVELKNAAKSLQEAEEAVQEWNDALKKM